MQSLREKHQRLACSSRQISIEPVSATESNIIMANDISREQLSEMIGLIYDCAINPENWTQALDALRYSLNFHNAAVSITNMANGITTQQFTRGIEEPWLALIDVYSPALIALWGGPARIASYPLEEPMVTSTIADPAEFAVNPYVTEWSAPQGLVDAAAIGLVRSNRMVASLGLGRHRDAGVVSPSEMDALRLLAPHLCRAVLLSDLLERRSIEASTFETVLDTLSVPILLVDAAMALTHANAAARVLLDQQDLLRSIRGVLHLADRAAEAKLMQAIEIVGRQEANLGRKGIAVPTRANSGAPSALTVLPLRGGRVRSALSQNAVAAIFVAPFEGAQTPIEVFSALYELTPAEGRVADLIARGMTPKEIGAEIGVATGTVKTHLLNALSKTNSRRQVELASLVRSFRPPA